MSNDFNDHFYSPESAPQSGKTGLSYPPLDAIFNFFPVLHVQTAMEAGSNPIIDLLLSTFEALKMKVHMMESTIVEVDGEELESHELTVEVAK